MCFKRKRISLIYFFSSFIVLARIQRKRKGRTIKNDVRGKEKSKKSEMIKKGYMKRNRKPNN